MENVGIFYDHLEYFTAIWCNFWPFGIDSGTYIFFPFWYVWTKKNLATLLDGRSEDASLNISVPELVKSCLSWIV
jgi:hypothetical protein